MFVTDWGNHRIQKFLLSTNSCICFPTNITLISKSSLLSPIEYKLNEEISISSNIQLNCEEFFLINNQWTIYNCSSDCSIEIELNKKIKTTFNEIYIPPKMLTYGIYKLKLTVNVSDLTLSESIYVEIVRSEKIIVNLIEYGISQITIGQKQELLLEPEKYSFDEDGNKLIPNNWEYEYYCRIYDQSFIEIDNSSCFTNRSENQRKSSLKISNNSLETNRTYQFMVSITNRQNLTLKYFGYLFVQIEDTYSYRIAIGCVISTMCISNEEFQLINPTTQVALFSYCIDNCLSNKNIKWNIYNGKINSLTNFTQWTLFNENLLLFGNNTNNLTVTNELFLNNLNIKYWKFEVIYLFEQGIGSSSMNFKINDPPSNGSCSINPRNGTTTTLFYISCEHWYDEHGIKDYSFYVWTNDFSKRIMIGFTLLSTIKVRLASGNNQNSLLNINIHIRDKLNSIKEYNISSIYIENNLTEIENLIQIFQYSKNDLINNSFIQILLNGNKNDIGQIITSISQQFNQINTDSLNYILSNAISISNISISTLGSKIPSSGNNFITKNETILDQYKKQINIYANIREYLINFIKNLPITNINSIILQSSSLVQLTEATNQLTRITSINVCEKCYELSVALNEISKEISFEYVQKATTFLTQCTSNILNGINGPLQQRTNILYSDLFNSNQSFDYLNKQKEIANEINKQINETIYLLTLSLNNHLNINQNYIINTSEVFMSLERISMNYLSNKQIKQIENSQINFPLNFSLNENILIRSKLESLSSYGNFQSNTNFSRSLSLSFINKNDNDILFKSNHFIEFIISRDPNIIIPPIILQNVSFLNQSFYYKSINITNIQSNTNLTISIHFQIQPLNQTLAYLFIYQFGYSIELNQLNGWTLFCPFNLTNENIYTYYIDNQQISKHQSIIFGLRELTSIEYEDFCLNNSTKNISIINHYSIFTSNYYLRIYSSGCYYLDLNNNWQSDGLFVGPKTNLYQTQCFTKHL